MDMEQWGDHAYIDNVEIVKLEIDDDIRGLFLKEWAQHIEMLTTWKAYKERLISNGACRNYCTEEEFENWVKDKVKWAKSLKL